MGIGAIRARGGPTGSLGLGQGPLVGRKIRAGHPLISHRENSFACELPGTHGGPLLGGEHVIGLGVNASGSKQEENGDPAGGMERHRVAG